MRWRALLLKKILLLLLLSDPLMGQSITPPLQHAQSLSRAMWDQLNFSDYYASEKLDGVRGYWDGERLYTRRGNPIDAPKWFTAPLGEVPLDGELWIDRERFNEVSTLVRYPRADDPLWHEVTYNIFDLPASTAPFAERVAEMARYLPSLKANWIRMIPQIPLNDGAHLQRLLSEIEAKGGEGVMIHHRQAIYQPGVRTALLLKVKSVADADGIVVAHIEGRGRNQGRLGALLLRLDDGRLLRLGSGFTDQERENPPPLGAVVTFRYNGYTQAGLPRFARFYRIRALNKEVSDK